MVEYTQFLIATEYQQTGICKTMVTDTKSDTAVEIENPFSKDVATLQKLFVLEKGATIQMPLREALILLPRERKRSDAYRKLQKHLQSVYGVNLILTIKNQNL